MAISQENYETQERGLAQKLMNRRPIGLIAVIIVAVILIFVLSRGASSYDFPTSASRWQAVFLSNNQVYFGHLKDYTRNNAALTNVYYLRIQDPLQPGSAAQPPLNLVKLGGELHGPDDAMYIPKGNILFWENLRQDSAVVQSINNFLTQKQ